MVPRFPTAALLFLLALVAPPAGAVEPGAAHARKPADLGLEAEDVTFPAVDSVTVRGWWFPGAANAPVIVVAPRGVGTMADLLPAVKEFHARGFQLLTFDYRGFGPGYEPAARDSLRYVFFSSGWVDDMAGALAYARVRGGRHVFAWGQDVGGPVAAAAAARDPKACDGVAVEGLFKTSQELLLANGASVLPGVELRHRQLVRPADEPLSAVSRLRVPLFVVIAERDSVAPPAVTRSVLARDRLRADVWVIPTAGHFGAEQTPGYFDRLSRWFLQWTALPPAQAQ